MKKLVQNKLKSIIWKITLFFILVLIINVNVIYTVLIIVPVLILYFIFKMQSNPKKEEFYWKVIQIIIAIFLIFFLTNEIVQPFFIPRVTNIEINPLYIQSEDIDNYEDINYSIIYEVKYKILPPLILVYPFNKMKLRVPGRESGEVYLVYSLQEENPYYDLTIDKPPYRTFISSSNLSGVFPIKITASALEIKNIEAIIIIKEKINLNNYENTGFSSTPLWADTKINPVSSKGEIYAKSNPTEIGYGLRQPSNIVFEIKTIDVKNNKNLEIFGLAIKTGEVDVVCDGDINLHIQNDFVSIGLKPNEIKRILLIKNVGGSGFEIPTYMKFVPFRGGWDDCSTYDQVYKKLLEST